ncbi:uncharacterized protein COLE_07118 [Cutaneotrichosporon oleaginosum]|uniref:uncharacterized protein n=1 Tax=Cutaneotrichosporon oleaginosum TaxID=879819 RepID=UPI0013237480|nr:hypothetical protein COLE_07118 [Cutaneotrichosporon oleaginosum]
MNPRRTSIKLFTPQLILSGPAPFGKAEAREWLSTKVFVHRMPLHHPDDSKSTTVIGVQ